MDTMDLQPLYDDANTPGSDKRWYSSSGGRIDLVISLFDAHRGYHQGACDSDIEELIDEPYIQELYLEQLEELKEQLRLMADVIIKEVKPL